MSISARDSLVLLFERPYEPVFFPKGDNDIILETPLELLSQRDRELQNLLPNRFGPGDDRNVVVVESLPDKPSTPVSPEPPAPGEARLPDAILAARQLPRSANFSTFVPWHRGLAAKLIEVFMEAGDAKELRSLAVAARERCNPQLFSYAFAVALLHRPDTRDMQLPPLVHTMPCKFLGADSLTRAFKEASLTDSQRQVVQIIPPNWTANDEEPEHRLAYFREDIGANMHHWHWHLVYPYEGPLSIVNKDRRGELFYYMHQQLMARYNVERFSLSMGRVKSLNSFRESLQEGYYSKLTHEFARSLGYPGRPDNSFLSSVSREMEKVFVDISDLERWEQRIFYAIHSGSYKTESGERVSLLDENGIDVLGNIVEASIISPNKNVYGDLHNMLHYMFGATHDPTGKHQESFQPIADNTTAIRDPAFYRLHAYIDDIFREHKHTLQPYTREQLNLPGVALMSMAVQTGAVPGEAQPPPPGVLRTFLQESELNLVGGLDFAPRGPIVVRVQHLQNAPFNYTYNVVNNTDDEKRVAVRVFLAPYNDERGIPLRFIDHKNYFIELDKFVETVPPGTTELRRSSSESSITIPWEQTFHYLDRSRPADDTSAEAQQFGYCGCGWPQHLLLPRGNAEGLKCLLFAMLTDFDQDKVEGSEEVDPSAGKEGCCKAAVSFCGLRDKKYPDKRAMGFPFDRQTADSNFLLQDFMRGLANMRTIDVTVQFTNRVLLRRGQGAAEATPV